MTFEKMLETHLNNAISNHPLFVHDKSEIAGILLEELSEVQIAFNKYKIYGKHGVVEELFDVMTVCIRADKYISEDPQSEIEVECTESWKGNPVQDILCAIFILAGSLGSGLMEDYISRSSALQMIRRIYSLSEHIISSYGKQPKK